MLQPIWVLLALGFSFQAFATQDLRMEPQSFFGDLFSPAPLWAEKLKDVAYGTSPEEKADLYLQFGKNNPAVVFIHGGGWSAGDKSGYDGYYARKYGWAGFSVISINYRLAKMEDPKSHWPAQLQDVQLAIRWVKKYADRLGVDPNRICASGDSAGGHLSLFLGALKKNQPGDRSKILAEYTPTVACVANLFGPADLTHPEFVKVFQKPALFGGRSFSEAPELWRRASPLFEIKADMPPTIVVHGLKDKIIANENAENLIRRLTDLRVSHRYISFDGGHWFEGLKPPSRKSEIDDEVLEFIRSVLRP